MTTGSRILFHTYNRRGLGHLIRGLNIASQLLNLSPATEILFYTRGMPPARFTDLDIEFFVEPEAKNASWRKVVRSFAPEIIVFDTMLPNTMWEASVPDYVELVYIMRKCSSDRQAEVFHHSLMGRINLILIPHDESEFGHNLPDDLAARSKFVGPIARQPDDSKRESLLERYGITPKTFTLLSTPGGGGFIDEATAFFDVAFRTHEILQVQLPELNHIIIKGPRYPEPLKTQKGMTIVDSEPDLVHLLPLADLVVSAGGYNTVTEIRVAKTPAVFLPSPRTHDDQLERVTAIESAGMARVCANGMPRAEISRVIAGLCTTPNELAKMRMCYQNDSLALGNQEAARHMLELVDR